MNIDPAFSRPLGRDSARWDDDGASGRTARLSVPAEALSVGPS